MPKRLIPILRRKPSQTFPVRACDDMTAWDTVLLYISLDVQCGRTSDDVVVRRPS